MLYSRAPALLNWIKRPWKSRRTYQDSLMSEMASKPISIHGTDATIYGFPSDPYFQDVQNHAANNAMLMGELASLPVGAHIIDVGANIGATTLIAARMVEGARVFAIEPSGRAFACLERTIAANGLRNCRPLRVAIGAAESRIEFVEREFLAGSHIRGSDGTPDGAVVSVQMTTLDKVVEDLELTRLDLVKVDVEGFELGVLEGAVGAISRYAPRFVMEFNSYAIAVNAGISPRLITDLILKLFGSFTIERNGSPVEVKSSQDVRDFIYSNMVVKQSVEDIVFGGGRMRTSPAAASA